MEGEQRKGGARAAIEVDHTSLKRLSLGPCDSKSIYINDKLLNTRTSRIQIPTRMDLHQHSLIQDVYKEYEMILTCIDIQYRYIYVCGYSLFTLSLGSHINKIPTCKGRGTEVIPTWSPVMEG